MRVIYALLLLVLLAAVGIFAYQNQTVISLDYLNWKADYPVAAVVGVAYVLGMFSGWMVVGFIKNSLQRITDRDRQRTQ